MAAFFSTPFRFGWREQRREVTLQRTPMSACRSGDPVPRMQPNQQFFMRVKRGGVSSSVGSRCVKYGWHNIVQRKQRCVGAEAWLRLIIREAISIDSLKKLRSAPSANFRLYAAASEESPSGIRKKRGFVNEPLDTSDVASARP